MLDVTLYRFFENKELTFGYIPIDGNLVCYTMELPWRDNEKDISCIPEGSYQATPIVHPNRGNIWQLLDVPDRTGIQIHVGNYPKDTHGCILPGLSFLSKENAIYSSRMALDQLIRDIGFIKFNLHIKSLK